MRVETVQEFADVIKQGMEKGHTHVQLCRRGYCDQFLSLESLAFKNIASDPMKYDVYAVRTGFPVYSNCNRFRYDPYISGVTEKENNSFGSGLMRFINN